MLDHRHALHVPSLIDFVTAAGIIEVFATANETVFELGSLASGEALLVHAGTSGVGTEAVQMAKSMDCTVYATVGSRTKADRVHDFGVDIVENFIGADYSREDYVRTALNMVGNTVPFDAGGHQR